MNEIAERIKKEQTEQEELDNLGEGERESVSQMAILMNNSTLLKTYESIIQTYEEDIGKKNNLIHEMENELQKIQYENSSLA